MKIIYTKFEGVILIEPKKHEDNRGFFSETFNKKKIKEFDNLEFVQDNQSLSLQRYIFRGLHFQIPPFAQDKLVRVIKGSILDFVLDIRKSSKTFGQIESFKLSSENFNQIFIPKGFAHGFLTLEDNTETIYKVTNYYSPEHDFGININDSSLNIDLPTDLKNITLSDKDKLQPNFKESKYYFD
ncbi:dTDP-4-dehydrorhamnose 3,5-epimerase [Candidatus Pelagibacter sp.]|nr:dTDP-4-dehydrorhamnose 3,5-epimerase [Candidatus Pelagibacter sp.]MDC1070456.1 dTDP-4-dehydrorhamnose 3,5-epimerase [Candidatus Pelagibacter sp.]